MPNSVSQSSSIEGQLGFSQKLGAIKGKVSKLFQGQRQVAALALIAIIVAVVIVMMMWSQSESYHPLYGQQEKFDSGQVVSVLEASNIDYRIDPNTGQVLVPDQALGQARMLLAAKGVKAKLPSGMELLDHLSIGTSQFIEQAKYRQSLEGELDRTIMSLDSIRQARVHLAIPKQTLFIRPEGEKATASVMLELASNTKLAPEQIAAIANLVSGSVNGLSPENVKIVDQYGHLLSNEISVNSSLSSNTDKQTQATHKIEQQLIKRVNKMLLPILGDGNFQVQISANVNFDQVEETKETLDPNAIVRSETNNIDESKGTQAKGVPGTLSNEPANKDKLSDETVSHKQSSRQFDVGRTIRHTQYQSMVLKKLSVSVLLNSNVAGKDGWEKPQLDNISKIVQDAIGFDSERGDKFSISDFKFIPPTIETIEDLPWWQQPNMLSYLKYLIAIVFSLLLIFLVLMPLVRTLTRSGTDVESQSFLKGKIDVLKNQIKKQPSQVTEEENVISDKKNNIAIKKDKKEIEEELSYDSMSLDVKKKHIGKLAKDDPARVAEVISHWIREKDNE